MKLLFVETSALLRILFQERAFEETQKRFENADRLMASRLIKIETERAILRAAKVQKEATEKIKSQLLTNARLIWPRFDFIEITKDICDAAGTVAPHANLRSLDAIHIATFWKLKSLFPQIQMVSYDERITSNTEV